MTPSAEWPSSGGGGPGPGGLEIESGLHEDRPAANTGANGLWRSTDRGGIVYLDTGLEWVAITDGILVRQDDADPIANNVLVQDDVLRFPVFEGDHFRWQVWLAVEGTSTTPDIRVNLNPPQTFAGGDNPAEIRWQQQLGQFAAAQTVDPGAITAGSPIGGLGPGIKGTSYAGWLRGDQLVTSGEEAVLEYSQQTTTAGNPITVKKGSCLILQDLTGR